MYFYMRGNAIVASDNLPECEEPVQLTPLEEAALIIVFNSLSEYGVDTSSLHCERTEEYLKAVANQFLCFFRLKLHGRSMYMELTISSKDAKTLCGDPRFLNVPLAKKRFTRIPISCVEDISKYCDILYLAYVWGTTTV